MSVLFGGQLGDEFISSVERTFEKAGGEAYYYADGNDLSARSSLIDDYYNQVVTLPVPIRPVGLILCRS